MELAIHSEPVSALAQVVMVNGVLGEGKRDLRERWRNGTLHEVEFEAVVWRDGPNANGFRFRASDLAGFGGSFAGQPFLRDHDVRHIASRDGTVVASAFEGGGFRQRIRLTTESGIGDFVQGRIDRFSIGWYYDGITCSVCGQDWLSTSCSHWPGQRYYVRDEQGGTENRLCELIFENPRGKETSAVNAPAVDGTRVLSELMAQKQELAKKEEVAMGASSEPVLKPAELVEPTAALERAEEGAPLAMALMETPIERPVEEPAAGGVSEWAAYLRMQAVEVALASSGLPAAARELVRGQVTDGTTPAQLDGLIEQQRKLVAALQKETLVTGVDRPLDGGRVAGMLTSVDQVGMALEALITGQQPAKGVRPLSGIREAYVLLSGDYEMRGLFVPENVGLSNVNSTTMAGIVANALNKVVVNTFQQYPRWWEAIVTTEKFTTLQEVKWITLGGVGELPTVAEGSAYTEMTWDDQTETAGWLKKGGYLGLTLEAIDRDDTRRIQMAPRALAQAAYLSLSKAVASIFTANAGVGPTMSDGKALFHADHGNLGSTALSYAAWTATRTAMRKQIELNSGERLGGIVVPKFLMVPPDLEGMALTVLLSEGQPGTGNNDENPWADGETRNARLAAARRNVIVVDLWTDANNWAAVADPLLYPVIGLGFRFGETPEVFSVATPNSGLMFTNDVMPVKVRYFFAVGPTDWRGFHKHNVA